MADISKLNGALMSLVMQIGKYMNDKGYNTVLEFEFIYDAISEINSKANIDNKWNNPQSESGDEYYVIAKKIIDEIIMTKIKVSGGNESVVIKEKKLLIKRIMIAAQSHIWDTKFKTAALHYDMEHKSKSNIINPFDKRR